MSCSVCNVGLEETKTSISQKQICEQALRGFRLMWTPRLLRSQSGGLFLELVSAVQFGQQMVFEREWGAIYSKQIFYLWQVMERATTVWRFNKSAQTYSGRTRLKWDTVTSAWLSDKPWSHRLVYFGKLYIFGCKRRIEILFSQQDTSIISSKRNYRRTTDVLEWQTGNIVILLEWKITCLCAYMSLKF